MRPVICSVLAAALVISRMALGATVTNPVVVCDDGGWCWYQDERAIHVGEDLLVGSLSSAGDVDVSILDVETMVASNVTLHAALQTDDHGVASFLHRDDDHIMAFYSKHGSDNLIRYRVTTYRDDATSWEPEQAMTNSAAVTYSNPFQLSGENGKIYLFYRCIGWNPTYVTSTNNGATWSTPAKLIDSPSERPYVKYCSDGSNTIHFVFTEAHPDEFEHTSIYHMYYRAGGLYQSDGTFITNLTDAPITPDMATRIYNGTNATGEAWTWDIHLDAAGHPVVPYATFANRDPDDHRYRYARWDGSQWRDHEAARGGTRLYTGQASYSGGIAVDPEQPDVVYISSDVDITNGTPNSSGKYELYRGETSDMGASWDWRAITSNSQADNLRPIVPIGHTNETTVLWLQGSYTSYTSYDQDVVGLFGSNVVVGSAVETNLFISATDVLVPFARFDINHGTSLTAYGYAGVDAAPGAFVVTNNGVVLAVTNNTAANSRNRTLTDPLQRDFIFNNTGVAGDAGVSNALQVALSGLMPNVPYHVRLHSHDNGNNAQPALWFQDTTSLDENGSDRVVGVFRILMNDPGDAYLDLVLNADESGRINLVGRKYNHLVLLNGVEVAEMPAVSPFVAFDVDLSLGAKTVPGFASLAFDHMNVQTGMASTNGVTLSVQSDRTNCLRDRSGGGDLLTDFVFANETLLVDVDGLVSGKTYQVTVHSQDMGGSDEDWNECWLTEEGGEPVRVRRMQWTDRCTGVVSRFTFFLETKASAFQLSMSDIGNTGSAIFNGLEIAEVTQLSISTLAYEQTIRGQGALAYWKLDEELGFSGAADSTPNSNPLIYNGVAPGNENAPLPTSYLGFAYENRFALFTNIASSALTKDGHGVFETYDRGDVTLNNQAGTMTLWFNAADAQQAGGDMTRVLFLASDGDAAFTGTALTLGIGSQNNTAAQQGRLCIAGDATAAWGTTDFTTSGWHMTTVTWDGRDVNLYVDGQRTVEATDGVGTTTDFTGAFRFGKNSGTPGRYYDGLMDEISMFDRPLTPADIVAQYNSAVDGKTRVKVLAIDIGPDGQDVQTGFQTMTFGVGVGHTPTPQSNTYDGVTVVLDVDAQDLGMRDRGDAAHTMGDVGEDFVFSYDTGGDLLLTLKGLPAADYEIVLYSHDNTNQGADFDVVVDGGDVQDSVSPATGANPRDVRSGMAAFTADGVNDTVVRLDYTGGTDFIRLNGFELHRVDSVDIPELPKPPSKGGMLILVR